MPRSRGRALFGWVLQMGLGIAVHASSAGAAENAVDRLQAIRSGPNGNVQIELYSSSGFPVRNEIAVLEIGGKEFLTSQYPPNGDTRTLIFTLTPEEFAKLRDGDRIVFKYGRGEQVEKKDFGRLDKKRLDKDKK